MTTRHWLLLVVLSLLGACNVYFLGGLRTDTYHGSVVDAQTGAPLPNTAVTVIWYTTSIISIERPRFFHNAQETVTAPDGTFSFQVYQGLDWNPATKRFRDPDIIVYCPGYEPLWAATMNNAGFNSPDTLIQALKVGVTVKLRRLPDTTKDLQEFSDAALFVNRDVPSEKIPRLIQAINVLRKGLGFTPYPISPEKGQGS